MELITEAEESTTGPASFTNTKAAATGTRLSWLFWSRQSDITLYLTLGFAGNDELLSKLGKYKTGKGCPYIRKISDVDPRILEQLIVDSVAARKRHHG